MLFLIKAVWFSDPVMRGLERCKHFNPTQLNLFIQCTERGVLLPCLVTGYTMSQKPGQDKYHGGWRTVVWSHEMGLYRDIRQQSAQIWRQENCFNTWGKLKSIWTKCLHWFSVGFSVLTVISGTQHSNKYFNVSGFLLSLFGKLFVVN